MTHRPIQFPHLYIAAEKDIAASHDGITVVFTGRWTWAAFGPDGGRALSGTAPSHAAALQDGQDALGLLRAAAQLADLVDEAFAESAA